MKPVISFVGKHNAGKTTFLSAVVRELTDLGVCVAVIKHSSSNLTISADTDSDKLFNAGAGQVGVISPDASIIYRRYKNEPQLSTVIENLSEEADLIITEGYKKEPFPKIEVMRQAISQESFKLNNTIAMVADFDIDTDIEKFSFQQTSEAAQFIIRNLLKSK